MKPATPDAYRLLHHGCIALSNVEANGMRIDVGYLERTFKDLDFKIKDLEQEIKSDKIFKLWKRQYGERTNLGSREQLGKILFDVLGHKCDNRTPTGKPKMDAATIASIEEPFAKLFVEIEQLKKIKNTFLSGIRKQVQDGFIHPVFNLHTVQTYRSSSDSPNFQNFPIRDPKAGELIRRCFIPREGHRIVEIDYTGLEVRIAACYHKDPTMLQYIKDESKDMHRDMAAECFKCKPDQVSKELRYCGKNMFVFPQFYGDFYINNAKSLWESIDAMGHEVDGVPMKEHLQQNGIRELGLCEPQEKPRTGTFEKHLQQVEKRFWNERFPVYGKWKKDWHQKYIRQGGFNTLTGFKIEGLLGKNDAINYPVQGSAFHCLLWSLIQLNNWLNKNNKRSKLVGQIHDSIVADVHDDELDEFLQIAKTIMTKKIRQKFEWINVPLDVEAEITPVNGSWFEKKEVEIK